MRRASRFFTFKTAVLSLALATGVSGFYLSQMTAARAPLTGGGMYQITQPLAKKLYWCQQRGFAPACVHAGDVLRKAGAEARATELYAVACNRHFEAGCERLTDHLPDDFGDSSAGEDRAPPPVNAPP